MCSLQGIQPRKNFFYFVIQILKYFLFNSIQQPLIQQGDLSAKDCVVALYDYDEKTAREISVKEGQVLTLLNSNNRVSWSYLGAI